MKADAKATVHYCDGCGKSHVQLENDDLPNGWYLDVIEVGNFGANAGRLYACNRRCLNKALDRRNEVWERNP